MPPATMYADLSRLQRPWRGNSALYNNLPTIAGQVMQQGEDDPYRKMLDQMGGDSVAAGGVSTRAAELASRIQQAQRGGIGTSATKSMIPSEASAALAGGSNTGYSKSFIDQLGEIGKMGSAATARQQAINAFRNRGSGSSGGGGGGAFPDLGGIKGARAKAIAMARSRLGDPYVWGGSRPGAFDCSGLVQWAYGKAGIRLPRVSQAQMTQGRRTSIGRLVPGDLVGWGHPAHHIAIYLGGGRILEAPRTGLNVRVTSLSRKGGGAWGIHLNI